MNSEDDRCTCGRATSPRFVVGTHHAQKCPMYDHPFEPRPEDWKISEEGAMKEALRWYGTDAPRAVVEAKARLYMGGRPTLFHPENRSAVRADVQTCDDYDAELFERAHLAGVSR